MELDEHNNLNFCSFPPGPLDFHRKQCKFDWRKLKLFIEDEDMLKMRVKYFEM